MTSYKKAKLFVSFETKLNETKYCDQLDDQDDNEFLKELQMDSDNSP